MMEELEEERRGRSLRGEEMDRNRHRDLERKEGRWEHLQKML